MAEGTKGDYGDIDPKEQEVWQKVTDFIKISELDNQGLVSTLETTDGINLSEVGVSVNKREGKIVVSLRVDQGTDEGKGKILEAVRKYVRTKVSPEVEVE